MSGRKRKPLEDVLSESEFVFGSSPEPASKPTPEPVSKTTSPEPPPETTPEPTSKTTLPEPPPETIPEPPPKPSPINAVKESIMSKLQIPEKEATVRFTVDMSESLHRKLSVLAAKTGRKKVDIVRIFLEEGLKDVDV
ncbi:MAG: hypothetical protein ACRCT1_15050 [Microcoleaceae cyanobacterium]